MKTIKAIKQKIYNDDLGYYEDVFFYLVHNIITGMKHYYYASCFTLEQVKKFENMK